MGFGVIAAVQELPAEFQSVVSADQSETVGNHGAANDGQAGEKDLRPKIAEPRDIQAGLRGNIGNDVKSGIVPLRLKSILR